MSAQTPQVLFVDDDEILLKLFTSICEREGMSCICAPNGEKALEILKTSERPELIILDISMPGTDGLDVLKKIKADPAVADIPVVIVSNFIKEEDITWGKELGVKRFVNKENLLPGEIADIIRAEALRH